MSLARLSTAVLTAAVCAVATLPAVSSYAADGRGADRSVQSDRSDRDRSAVVARRDQTVSRRYSSYRYAHVPDLGLCLGVYVTATLKARYDRRPISQGAVSELDKPTIHDPAMQFTIKKRCDDNSAYKKRHRADKISYRNLYYGYTCSYDPSFSVGAPWSVGVGVTPDCGDERVAKYGSSDTRAQRAYRFNLDTEGYAFGWNGKDSTVEPGTVKLCTSVSGYFRLQDTKGAERRTVIKKVAFPDACISR